MRFNIQYKITTLIAAVVAVTLLSFYYYFKANLYENTYQRIRNRIIRDTALAEEYLKLRYTADSSILETDAIADLIGERLGLRVTIIDLEGVVIGDSKLTINQVKGIDNHKNRPEIIAASKDYLGVGESTRYSTTTKTQMLYYADRFEIKGARGYLRLSIPLSEIDAITKNLRDTVFLSSLLAFFLVCVISFFASHLISNPIKYIALIAKSIAKGNYHKKVRIHSNDEIEDLSHAVNYMSDQIETQVAEALSHQTKLRATLLSMFEGIMVLNRDSEIVLVNNSLKNLLNVVDDPVGQKPIAVIRNMDIQDMASKILDESKNLISREISVFIPEEKIILIHASPILNQKKLDGAVLVFHDMTELRQLERIRRDFVANVSHELRTPITNIRGYSETLMEGAINDRENAMEFLRIINTDSQRLNQLVNDLLELSRVESGKMELDIREVDIKNLINMVLGGFKQQLAKKHIKIETHFIKDIQKIRADESQLMQVLVNLIDNAIKYNRDGGKITLSVHSMDESVSIEVKDTGIGISQRDLERIFERFYQVDKARNKDLGGTGLGLSISKHIVQAHGGLLTVKSELNKGTVFTIVLPK